MDMPINIVPAPAGQLVALYVSVPNNELAKKFNAHFSEEAVGVEFYIRPVVAWGVHKDGAGRVTNGPLVADEHGGLTFPGHELTKYETDELFYLGDMQAHEFQGVCTLTEAEFRVRAIAEASKMPFTRISNGEFRGELCEIPNNFSLTPDRPSAATP